MEIYSLNDSLAAPAPLQITDIKQAVKNPNRVNVYVNGKYSFSLDIAQVVDLKIKIHQQITEKDLANYQKASEFGKAYQRALEWVLIRPRSSQELHDYLKRSKYKSELKNRQQEWQNTQKTNRSERERQSAHSHHPTHPLGQYDFSDLIFQRLVEKNYVDDRKFAEYYVENRFVKKGISRRRLSLELSQKGIDKGIIDQVLISRNETEEIQKIITKKRKKYDDNKLIQYLCQQGFPYDLVKSLVKEN